MTEPQITVRLDHLRREYQPGEALHGEFRLDDVDLQEIQSVELSVLWYTEGKGEEDFGVHYFRSWTPDTIDAPSFDRGMRFETELPHSPLSYDGVILKIHWCVRVRLFLPRGTSLLHDEPFRLGHVPKVVPPAEVA